MLRGMSDELTESPAVSPMPEVAPTRPRRWPHPLITAAVGLLLGAGAVGAAWALSGSSTPASFTLRGSLTLTGDNVPSGDTSEDCTGYEGYDDIAKGAIVTVYDTAGRIVGSGALGTGKPSSGACVFPISVPDVAGGSKFYQVEVSHRGKLTVSAAKAKSGGFASSLG
jgi:hypothetical protein